VAAAVATAATSEEGQIDKEGGGEGDGLIQLASGSQSIGTRGRSTAAAASILENFTVQSGSIANDRRSRSEQA